MKRHTHKPDCPACIDAAAAAGVHALMSQVIQVGAMIDADTLTGYQPIVRSVLHAQLAAGTVTLPCCWEESRPYAVSPSVGYPGGFDDAEGRARWIMEGADERLVRAALNACVMDARMVKRYRRVGEQT